MKTLWKPGTLMSPLPVIPVSCGTMEKPNIVTVAWTGIICSEPSKTYISLRKERFSHEIISESRKFVLNLATTSMIKSIDLCGVKSGRDIDKFAECGLTCEPSLKLGCPSIAESPVSLECVVTDIIELGSHDMFIADIVAVNVDEEYIVDGKLCIEKASLAAYAHGTYFALGKKINTFGFSVRKKKKPRR